MLLNLSLFPGHEAPPSPTIFYVLQKSYSCNSSFDHEHTVLPGDVDSCTLVIELINPDNSTDYDFTLHIRDETHFPPTKGN